MLQVDKQQVEPQGRAFNAQESVFNKDWYSIKTDSTIASENQCANIKDCHIKQVCTNNANSTSQFDLMKTGYNGLQYGRGIGVNNNNHEDKFKVDFTIWMFVDQQTAKPIYIVVIHNLGNNKCARFYYFYLHHDTRDTLNRCENVPTGNLCVMTSSWWSISLKMVNYQTI